MELLSLHPSLLSASWYNLTQRSGTDEKNKGKKRPNSQFEFDNSNRWKYSLACEVLKKEIENIFHYPRHNNAVEEEVNRRLQCGLTCLLPLRWSENLDIFFFFGVRYERLVFGGKPTDETVVSSENKAVEQWRCSTHWGKWLFRFRGIKKRVGDAQMRIVYTLRL